MIGTAVDDAYLDAAAAISLSSARDVAVAYTPLHGCGSTSVQRVLERLGFTVTPDPRTSTPSGAFEHVTFNIPNPEVVESFETPLAHAKAIDADILLSTDPDADRVGLMVKHDGEWRFLNGNENRRHPVSLRHREAARRRAGGVGSSSRPWSRRTCSPRSAAATTSR